MAVGDVHEDDRDQVVGDAHAHDQQCGHDHEGQHQAAAAEVTECVEEGEEAAPVALLLGRHRELVRLLHHGGPVEAALGDVDDQARHAGAEAPEEEQGLGARDRGQQGGGQAGQDVADAGTGRDHGIDPLALEQVEMLGDEGPEEQHHKLERDRVEDVDRESDPGLALGDLVDEKDRDREQRVGEQVVAEGAADPEATDQRPLQRHRRPDGQRQQDEEERVRLGARLDQEDGLGDVEGAVHAPAQHQRQARHADDPRHLAAPDVEGAREQEEEGFSCYQRRHGARGL